MATVGRHAVLGREGVVGREAVLGSASQLPFNPLLLPGLALWVRADSLITLNGADVATWGDKSGTGNDLAQGTGANQPLFVASGQNAQPLVRFTGANSDVLHKAANPIGTGAYSLAIVLSVPDSGALKGYFANTTTSGGVTLRKDATNVRSVTHPGVAAHDDGVMGAAVEIQTVTRAAATAPLLWVNGVSRAVSGAGGGMNDANGGAEIGIGAEWGAVAFQFFCDCDVYEAFLCTASLSSTDRRNLELYLGARYAIAV